MRDISNSVAIVLFLVATAARAEQCSDYYDPHAGHGDIDKNAVNLQADGTYSKLTFHLTSQYVLDRQHLPLAPGSYDDLTYYNGKPYRPQDVPKIEAEAKSKGGVYCEPYGISGDFSGSSAPQEMSSKTFYPSLGFYSDKTGQAIAANDFTRKNCIAETQAMFQIGGGVNTAGFTCHTGGPKQGITPDDVRKAFGPAIQVNGGRANSLAHLADNLQALSTIPYIGGAAQASSSLLRRFTANTGSSNADGGSGASSAGNASQ